MKKSAKNSFSGIYKSSFAFRPAIVAASGDVMEVRGGGGGGEGCHVSREAARLLGRSGALS